MKKSFLTLSLLSLSIITFSQGFHMPKQYTGKRHRGFYLSMALGLNSTSIEVDSKNYGFASYTGPGAAFDFKIGGAISENLILHATFLGHGVVGPTVNSNDWGINNIKTDDKLSISQGMIGGGITYYTQDNFLLSTSLGFGGFSYFDETEDIEFTTQNGFSYQIKLGKEWWVSPKWGLGVAVYYHNTNVINQKGNDAEEIIKGNNYGIVFNATLNGRK